MNQSEPLSKSYSYRVIAVFVAAIVLLAVVIALRPSSASGIPKSLFWQKKFKGDQEFRLVAAGDSRTLRDIVPEEFSAHGLGAALNFGFQGAALGEKFLDEAVSRLEGQKEPVLLLGVTPNAFTPSAERSNGFDKSKSDLSRWDSYTPNWYRRIAQQLEPMSLAELRQIISRRPSRKKEVYHADGWLETIQKKPNEKYALRFYRDRFNQNMASPKLVDQFLTQVAELSEKKIRVFAFRPPITQAMADIENEKSGFDYSEFKTKFALAGGTWIDVVDTDYQTYDGSHLVGESARRLTQLLAKSISEHLNSNQVAR